MRRGYVLITVLWVIAGASALTFLAESAARESLLASANRRALTHAMWTAEGCVAVLRTRLDSSLTDSSAWDHVDSIVAGLPHPSCVIVAEAGGAHPDNDGRPDGRIPLNNAPLSVIANLPGFGVEAVERMSEIRSQGIRISGLPQLVSMLHGDARDSMERHLLELHDIVTTTPDSWIVSTSAPRDADRLVFTIELKLADAGGHVVVVRRREP